MKVIFVSMDTVRADRLKSNGYGRRLTPNLDRIAAEGASFSQAFASDIPTQPSHTALFTGRYGLSTEIVSHYHPASQLDPTAPWLPSILHRAGYTTGAVDHLFAMKDWFVRGYDDYMPPPGRSRSPGSVINEIGFPWIKAHAGEDFSLLLHYWDAHIPYVPPSPFKETYTSDSEGWTDPLVEQQLRSRPSYALFKRNLYDHLGKIPNLEYIADLYDAEIAYLDFEIGRLFDHLERLEIADETMVVLFGDHGEVMTEHDSWFDHAGLYDSVVHVPLIIWAPGLVPSTRIDSMVSLIDVMPTVLELLRLPVMDGLDGRSMVPLINGEVDTHRDTVMLSECTWQAKRGIRTSEWKYIRCYDPGIYPRAEDELYNVVDDPAEQSNIASEHPEVLADLGGQLDRWLAGLLGDRPDPMQRVIADGLPAVARLDAILDGTEPPVAESAGGALATLTAGYLEPVIDGGIEPARDPLPTLTSPGALASKYLHRGGPRRVGLVLGVALLAAVLLGYTINSVFFSSPVQAAGVVQPSSNAQLDFPVAGPVSHILVHTGQQVKTGAILAEQDATALRSKLASDQAKLTSDQANLQQVGSPATPATVTRLQDQINQAQAQLSAAQAKVTSVKTVDDATVAAARAAIASAQATLAVDQQTAAADSAQCSPAAQQANPNPICAANARQFATDQNTLTAANSALAQAVANESADLSAAQSAVNVAQTAVATAQAQLAETTQSGTTAASSSVQALIAADQATIATDQDAINAMVLRAPFDGVIASVNGTQGETDTPQGVRQPTPQTGVPQPSSSSISIFPNQAKPQTTQPQAFSSLFSLNSSETKIVAQVNETDIHAIHIGSLAEVSLPAVPGKNFTARVDKIDPSATYNNGSPVFLVELVLSQAGSPSGTLSGQSADVSFL